MIPRQSVLHAARLLVVASASLLAACSLNRPTDEPEPGYQPVAVVFANESLEQCDVFAVVSGGGEARRLGTVMAGRTETLRVGSDLATRGSVSLVARLTNGRTLSTGVVPLHPGDTVHVQLPLSPNTLIFLP